MFAALCHVVVDVGPISTILIHVVHLSDEAAGLWGAGVHYHEQCQLYVKTEEAPHPECHAFITCSPSLVPKVASRFRLLQYPTLIR